MEVIRHLFGMCGEHSHPSIFNIGMIIPEVYFVIKIVKHLFYGKTKTDIPSGKFVI